MDKKLFGSVITVLILLSALWVIAGGLGSLSAWQTIDNTTLSTNGTVANWSSNWTNNAKNYKMFVNMTIYPNFTYNGTGVSPHTYNISNFTINFGGMGAFFDVSFSKGHDACGTNCNDTFTYEYNTTNSFYNTTKFSCHTVGSSNIQCDKFKIDDISGNATIRTHFYLIQNKSTEAEGFYTWTVNVYTNNSEINDDKTFQFGVDDLAPRLKELNITDGINVLSTSNGDFSRTTGTEFLRHNDLNVSIILTEYNRGLVKIYWDWNGTTTIKMGNEGPKLFNETAGRTNGTLTSPCNRADINTQECLYSLTIKAGNFTEGTMYSIILWTNDTFNQTANFSNSGSGYNITIDNSSPSGVLTISKSGIFATNAIKIKCKPSDSVSPVLTTIKVTKPSGNIIEKKVAGTSWETEFKNKETSEAGKYKVDCTVKDSVNFGRKLPQKTFLVYFQDSSNGEVSAAKPIADVDVSTSAEPTGTIGGKQGESKTFTLDGTTAHTIEFLEVGLISAKMLISSEPVEITLDVGQYKNVDVDGDGTDDIKITLKEIDNGLAKVEVINLPMLEQKRAEERGEVDAGIPEAEEVGRAGLWITILVILVIIVVGYFVLTKKKGKKGEVKFSRKDLGI